MSTLNCLEGVCTRFSDTFLLEIVALVCFRGVLSAYHLVDFLVIARRVPAVSNVQ